MRKTGLSVLLFVLLAVWALPAAAQGLAPEYVESEPSEGETLHKAPAEVVVRFSEPLDESSNMEVRDECGGRVDDGNVAVNLSEMSVGIAKEPAGTYKVTYIAKGIRGLTGQTMGSFTFEVHAGKSCDGSEGSGGHEGHGGGGDGGGNEHEGHGGGGDDGHMGSGGGDHSGMDHTTTDGSTDHSSTDHSEMDHSDGTMDHSKHKKMNHRKHKKHERKVKSPKRSLPPQAGPDDPLGGTVEGSAVLLSLGLSLVFGAAGGWYLRTTAAR